MSHSLYTCGKVLWYPLNRRLIGYQNQPEHFRKIETSCNLLLMLGIEKQSVDIQPVAKSLYWFIYNNDTNCINYVILNVSFIAAALGIAVLHIYAACIMTSLDMAGVQVSTLKVSRVHKEDWLNYLDAETKACAWFGSPMSIPPANPVKDIPHPEGVPVEFEVGIACEIEYRNHFIYGTGLKNYIKIYSPNKELISQSKALARKLPCLCKC